LDEIGFYTLAGAPESPATLIDEVREAERLGLGAVFISERFNSKEAATLSGAAAASSERMRIITAATNHNTRHPIVTASYASTMHLITGGRFTLGIGRGIEPMFDAFGIPRITTVQMEEFASVMRRLWKGEAIVGYDGPLGAYPVLYLDRSFDLDIPLGLVAFGPNSLELGPGNCQRASISYNAGIGRYLMWQQICSDKSMDTRFCGGVGIYEAPEPWGPWKTVYYSEKWDIGPGELGCFPTKWMSEDGKTVYLVFSGMDNFSVRRAVLTLK
jgi:hypothetical protein